MFTEVIFSKPNLDCCTTPANLCWHDLSWRFWRCQNWHFLLPNSLWTKSDLRLSLDFKNVGLPRNEVFNNSSEFIWPKVLRLCMCWTLSKKKNYLICKNPVSSRLEGNIVRSRNMGRSHRQGGSKAPASGGTTAQRSSSDISL